MPGNGLREAHGTRDLGAPVVVDSENSRWTASRFHFISSDRPTLVATTNRASRSRYFGCFNHLILYHLKWTVAGINQRSGWGTGEEENLTNSWKPNFRLSLRAEPGQAVCAGTPGSALCLSSSYPDLVSPIPIKNFFKKKKNLKMFSTNRLPVTSLCTLHADSHLLLLK